jgi:8-oxo-dGTP pyrophosphatase MutT (NUDIX family)
MRPEKPAPPELRNASTIILVREKNNTLEIYLLRRSTKAGFMGGLYVFPGGVVDPEDLGFDVWAPHLDMTLDQVENRLGGDRISGEQILGFGIAAIRETLEESGVFLASGRGKTQKEMAAISTYRLRPNLAPSWFKARIHEENWTLSLSSLGRWSHWITPKRMKKRFDTRFFIVFMPEHQTCVPDNMETSHGIWISPQDALEQNLTARVPLSPPAVVTLTDLSAFDTLAALRREIRTRPWGQPIAPRMIPSEAGPVIIEPWDPMFDRGESIDLSISTLEQKVLEPGSLFSRIWCDNGVWKPVGI